MAEYKAPERDIKFALRNVLNVDQLAELDVFADATPDIIDGVIDEAAKFIEARLLPLRESGDAQGCKVADNVVTVPDGYAEAYRDFVESGWVGLCNDPQWGGQGLPYTLSKVVEEMTCAANVAFDLYPSLTNGCFEALQAHASDEQKATYLPKLGTGEWTGTMCITEPQAGSDLAAVRTKAVKQADGSYRISGMKIFITSGEHEMTDNIVHYVLARCDDSPEGIKGLSTFIVPKYLVNSDGSLGERNPVKCQAIEHKMGINASVTCVMVFEEAIGYLVGDQNRGIMNMFTMMNLARIMVGYQGLGQAELATQNAIRYAKERIQGKTLTGGDGPIADHPDVRRMLMTMKAYTEAARVMAYETAIHVDLAHQHPDASVREDANDWVELTTPLVKAFCTDLAVENGSSAIQVYGGHGFIKEHGIEQIVRDSKILCLYEGTNGIQAMDLVRRKLQLHGGRLAQRFFDRVRVAINDAESELDFISAPLDRALTALEATTQWLRDRFNDNPNDAGAGAVQYQRAFALTMLGYNWLRMADAALAYTDDADFKAAKLATARFFATRLLPEVHSLLEAVEAGDNGMMDLALDAL
ncbi:acyl-CoA dehydrogenase [Oceanococcus atlanticus]|uniref:3-methylmercaptopropionyl-CoA dehydrogenase n=1 Tax=Oceanococcus atlanticus TaxID=1317117 RepID=A0A1Y1SAD7_9GAMM|nr:acyl-CoA dehydrogenase C-terminal domain-containing protein [Oceanococcus atlanticus]ORE85274.1 acyl-CoA dehydrogenase [Oceanococcus atlanticus]